MSKRIVVIAGEPSGDRLGAQLAGELQRLDPRLEIEGIFGAAMIDAGCLQLASMDTLAVMGFVDPIKSLPSILRLRRWIIRYLLEDPPDLFIGIDAPDFNLGIEKIMRRNGIATVHLVSPTIWAWRAGRIKTIQQATDLMLCIFPFEEQIYRDHNVRAQFIGHPTADLVPMDIDKAQAKIKLGFAPQDQVLAMLPGSRNSELQHMVPIYLQTLKICHARMPQLQFVCPLVQPAYEQYIEQLRSELAPELTIKYVIKDSFAVLAAADCALVTSGTATLETMLHKTPMVISYRTNWFNYQIGKKLIRVKFIGLPNLLANAPVVPEFIQAQATPHNLASALCNLLGSESLRDQQLAQFYKIHQQLRQGASQKAAATIMEIISANGEEYASGGSG